MNDFFDAIDPSHLIKDLIVHIQQCSHDIERISLDKQASEQRLKEMLGHTKHGSHTHEFLDYKITVTTGSNFTLDKNAFADYLMGDRKIDSRYDVVKPVSSYEINKKALTNLDMFGSQADIELKNKFIRQSDKKLHIRIVKNEPIVNDVNYSFDVSSMLTDDVEH